MVWIFARDISWQFFRFFTNVLTFQCHSINKINIENCTRTKILSFLSSGVTILIKAFSCQSGAQMD